LRKISEILTASEDDEKPFGTSDLSEHESMRYSRSLNAYLVYFTDQHKQQSYNNQGILGPLRDNALDQCTPAKCPSTPSSSSSESSTSFSPFTFPDAEIPSTQPLGDLQGVSR